MVEHDKLSARPAELMRRAVAGVRASRSPTPEAQARVFAALELRLGVPLADVDASDGMGTVGPDPATSAPVTIGWVAKVIGATAGLTVAGLLLLRVGVGALQTTTVEGEPHREQRSVSDTGKVGDTSARDDDAGEPVVETVPVNVAGTAVPAKPIVKPRELAATDTLAAELALVGAAKRASTPDAALVLLDQHAREYPNGAMVSEREALAVVALCQVDRTDEARARARVLIAARPGLPLLQGMCRDCPALADLLRQLPP
jgi:hypothetical protein